MTSLILQTERLILTPHTVQDYDDLCTQWTDADFSMACLGRLMGKEEIWLRLLRDLGHWQVMGYGNWTARLKDTGAYVGSVGVFDYKRDLDPPLALPELGWGVGAAYQGKGFAGEALRAVLEWVDSQLCPVATCCLISPDNAPSAKLAQRVGYTFVRTVNFHGADARLFERITPAKTTTG